MAKELFLILIGGATASMWWAWAVLHPRGPEIVPLALCSFAGLVYLIAVHWDDK